MENVIPKYERPIANINDPVNKVECWDKATNAFDEKDFKTSVTEVINYINPSLLDEKDTSGDIEIIQMQGSAEIHLKITNETFQIRAPFLSITDQSNKVALLRRIAELNFSPLTLAQITLHNEELRFEYEMPLSVCYPNKVYDVLREVCVYADDYDDEFIEKYKVDFYKKPKIKRLTADEQEIVWGQIAAALQQYEDYTQFFKEKRWDDFQWDIMLIALLQISNMPYVHGKLRSDLIEQISMLYNSDIEFNHRVDRGVNFMKKLTSKSREEIMENVYHADILISLRWRSSEQIISDRLKNYLERVQQYEKDESNFNMSYFLIVIFMKLIYDFNLEDNYKTAIKDTLEEVSGLDPSSAAPILTKLFYAMQTGSINHKEVEKAPEKKGFFSSLFN